MIEMKEWDGFEGRLWKEEINVRQFIQDNYTPYDGDESFLADPTDATNKLWDALQKLQKEERAKGGVLDMETSEKRSRHCSLSCRTKRPLIIPLQALWCRSSMNCWYTSRMKGAAGS